MALKLERSHWRRTIFIPIVGLLQLFSKIRFLNSSTVHRRLRPCPSCGSNRDQYYPSQLGRRGLITSQYSKTTTLYEATVALDKQDARTPQYPCSPAQCHSKVCLSETYFASLLLWPLVVPKRQSVRLFRLRFRTLQGLKHYVSMNEWSG